MLIIAGTSGRGATSGGGVGGGTRGGSVNVLPIFKLALGVIWLSNISSRSWTVNHLTNGFGDSQFIL